MDHFEMKRCLARLVLIVGVVCSVQAPRAMSAELPVFLDYCTEYSQRATTPAQRFADYFQCNSAESQAKSQLQKHWSLVTDDDMKICMKYKGTQDEIRSYQNLMLCLSQFVGSRCYAGKMICSGIPR